MEKAIIRTVLQVMLPLGSDAASSEALQKANQIIWKLVIPAPGKTEPEFSANVARRMLGVMLAQMGYMPASGKDDTIRDLSSDARLDLVINTAICLVFGYKRWNGRQYSTYLYDNPCLEFYRAFPRRAMRDWPERWKAVGGRFFPGESSYPQGRMIALADDAIWTTISAFGLPFPPFDFQSGMDVRPVSREEVAEMGMMQIDHTIQAATLSASGEFQERFAAKLHENLAKLEADEERRLADPLNFGTGDELLRLAEETIEESKNLSSEQIRRVVSFVEKAIERGVGNDLSECRSLAFIYAAINEPMQAAFYGQKATELEFAHLMSRGSSYELINYAEGLLASAQEMTPETVKQILILIDRAFEKGVGAKYNLRARAHKVLAQAYAREPDIQITDERYLGQLNEALSKSEANRVQYVENADGFLLLKDAKTALAIFRGRIEQETGARILDMLTKAVQRLPENCPHLHAEAYRLTAEVLEALGDRTRAIEYYECALLKNPKIGVKHRLVALKKQASGIDIPK